MQVGSYDVVLPTTQEATSVIDETSTSGASRLLRKWIRQPLTNVKEIELRLNRIEELLDNSKIRDRIVKLLDNCFDIERIISKISANKSNPREILSLANSLEILDKIQKEVKINKLPNTFKLVKSNKNLNSIINKVKKTILEDPPINYFKGRFIRKGISSELDEYKKLSSNIKTLKKKFNRNLRVNREMAQ